MNLFFYVVAGAAVAMALLWYFVIAPIEKRNHERKLAMLQEKIRMHEAKMRGEIPADERPADDVGTD